MSPLLLRITGSGLLMSAIALVGSVTLLLQERLLKRILLPLVAFAAGSLLGGASFRLDVSFLAPFAAGNFSYVGASGLIPKVKSHAALSANVAHFAAFAAGVALMLAARLLLEP